MSDRVIYYVNRRRIESFRDVPVIMHDADSFVTYATNAQGWHAYGECVVGQCIKGHECEPPDPDEITAARATLPNTPVVDHFKEARDG